MRNPFVHRIGGVLSADIAVPDHDRELEFYSKILTTGDQPLWRDDLTNNLGTPIIGLGVRTPEYSSLPLQWMPHFQVADVAASVTSTIDRGGKALMHAQNDEWAVLTDPAGAAFGIIPVVESATDSSHQNSRQGCISWLSLTVPDALMIQEFYQHVVGWNGQSIEVDPSQEHVAKFEMQIDSETVAAEILQPHSSEAGIPSAWLIHLPVADLPESIRRIGESDGKVIKEFADGKCAIVRDPVGVFFALRAS